MNTPNTTTSTGATSASAAASKPIRVMLADDHKIVREGLRSLLEDEADLRVVAEASDGRSAVELAREHTPDVVVMDIAMPQLNGVEATRQVINSVPRARVIALSMHSDRRFMSEMLRAGASGYLLKDAASEELIQAIRTVMDGKIYLSPQITDVVVDDYLRRLPEDGGMYAPAAAGRGAFAVLTAREREVLQLMAEGKATKQIAMILHVSIKTVETHRRQLMEKLDLHSVAELTKYAIREGLTTVDA
jgi:two-component system, NarL family, response regulator NreC